MEVQCYFYVYLNFCCFTTMSYSGPRKNYQLNWVANVGVGKIFSRGVH